MSTTVEHLPAQSRFVLRLPEGEATLSYQMRSPTVMETTSTYVPSAARGRGAAAQLVVAALGYASERGLQIVPSCWYVAEYIGKHPEFAPLLEPSHANQDRGGASCDVG